MKKIIFFSIAVLISASNCFSQAAYTPQIVLDKQVKAGELTFFPEIGSTTRYYYLPNQPKLKINADGTPVFSFIKYVKNVKSESEKDIQLGNGGGIVHLLFGLEVTPEELKAAKKELQKIVPGAEIVAPVIYRSGTVALISSDPEDKNKKRVCGVGSAPVMDGDYIAVAIRLLDDEAKLMWESFKTPAPDISFNFDMVLAGYNSPVKAKVTMNYEQIYSHKIFSAGLAMNMIQADIQYAVQDMVKNGAIKIEQVGTEEKMEAILDRIVQEFTKEFCREIGSSDGPNWGELAKMPDNERKMLNHATEMYNKNKEEQKEKEKQDKEEQREKEKQDKEEQKEKEKQDKAVPANSVEGGKDKETKSDQKSNEPDNSKNADSNEEPSDISKSVDYDKIVETTPQTGSENAKDSQNKKGGNSGNSFSIAISYQMKEIRVKGQKTFDFEKSLATTINTSFGGNVGKVSCNDCFREINLWDAQLIQREISASIDGMNSSDFGQYVNYANVQLRKTHESGQVTDDEVRIDRNNFNKEGNYFKMLYGWDGDNDRNRWFNYDYKINWSFFGGYDIVDSAWHKNNSAAINISAPFQRKSVELVYNNVDELISKGVIMVQAKIYYKLGKEERIIQATLNPKNKEITSKTLDFILPKGKNDFEYELTWVLTGNVTKSSGRKTWSLDQLYVDEVNF